MSIVFFWRYNTNIASLHLEEHNYLKVGLLISESEVCLYVSVGECTVYWVNCYMQKMNFDFSRKQSLSLFPPSEADQIYTVVGNGDHVSTFLKFTHITREMGAKSKIISKDSLKSL